MILVWGNNMKTQLEVAVGRLALSPLAPPPRLQTAGGRRPPDDRGRGRRGSPAGRRSTRHLARVSGAIAGMIVGASLANAEPASLPDLSGNYRCDGSDRVCRSGATFTITQSGTDLQIKNDKGDTGTGKLTSNITLTAGPVWNMNGVIITPDNRTIQWSNGTNWRKQ